jgi:hypothetical protein
VGVRLNAAHGLLAVALRTAEVAIHRLTGQTIAPRPYAQLSLEAWAVTAAHLTAVTALEWSPDEEVLCVGYRGLGFAVYHFSGPCLMTTVTKSGVPEDKAIEGQPSGIRDAAWDKEGCHLVVAAARSPSFNEIAFAKNIAVRNPTQNTRGGIFLQGPDRLLQLHMTDADFLPANVEVIPLPSAFLAAGWPLQFVSVSEDGQHVVVTGARGCALFSVALHKWRTYSWDTAEKGPRCVAPAQWVQGIVVVLPTVDPPTHRFPLVFVPRHPFDSTAVLHTEILEHQPIRLDVVSVGPTHTALLVYDASHTLIIYSVWVSADSVLSPTRVTVEVAPLHRVQMDPTGPFPLAVRLIPIPGVPPLAPNSLRTQRGTKPAAPLPVPCRVLLHRAGHRLTEYVPALGREFPLLSDVAAFWIDLFALSSQQLLLLTYNLQGVRLHSFTVRPAPRGDTGTLSQLPSLSAVANGPKSPYYFTTLLQDPDPETFPLGIAKGILVQGMQGVSPGPTPEATPSYQVQSKPSLYSHGTLLGLVLQSSALELGSPSPQRRCISPTPVPVSENLTPIPFPPAPMVDGLSAFSEDIQPLSPHRSPLPRTFSIDSVQGPSEASLTPSQFGVPQATATAFVAATHPPLQAGATPSSGSPTPQRLIDVGPPLAAHLRAVTVGVVNRLKTGTTFPQCMEYLLHSVLHADEMYEKRPDYSRPAALRVVVELLRQYHEYYDIIVGCIRKTDLNKWPLLFDVVGSPLVIFDECMQTGRVVTAAHLLRVLQLPMSVDFAVEKGLPDAEAEELRERAALTCAQEGARRLFSLALRSYRFPLALELLRFVGLITSEIASDLPLPSHRPPRARSGGLQISDGAQAIVPSPDASERSFEWRAASSFHESDLDTTASTPVRVLRGDRLLRIQLETVACELVTHGRLRQATELFMTFRLDFSHFLRTHRAGCAKVGDLVATFTAIHQDFQLPRCPTLLTLPRLPVAADVPVNGGATHEHAHHRGIVDRHIALRQYALKYESLYRLTVGSLDSADTPACGEDLTATAMEYGDFLTHTQLRLLATPNTILPLTNLLQAFVDCGCHEYALLLATILLQLPAIENLLRSDRTLFQPFVNLLCQPDNLGYSELHRHLLKLYNTGALYATPTLPVSPLSVSHVGLV